MAGSGRGICRERDNLAGNGGVGQAGTGDRGNGIRGLDGQGAIYCPADTAPTPRNLEVIAVVRYTALGRYPKCRRTPPACSELCLNMEVGPFSTIWYFNYAV